MVRLSQLVLNDLPNDVAVISERSTVSYGQLQKLSNCFLQDAVSSSVIISVTDVGQMLQLATLCDGICNSLLIAPASCSLAELREMGETFESDVLILRDEYETDIDSLPKRNQLDSVDTKWIFTTSGTSSKPKLVANSFGSIAHRFAFNQAPKRDSFWGLLYDHARFAGFQVVLRSLQTKASLIQPPMGSVHQQISFLSSSGCTHLSATPSYWRKLLMCDLSSRLPLKQITLGGEIVDQSVLNMLRSMFPSAQVTHIYASTEAGAVFSVKDGLAGFPRSFLESNPGDVALRIIDSKLFVKPLDSRATYIAEPDSEIVGENGWIDTGDLIIENNDRLLFGGRVSGQINVGGNKVSPERVEQELVKFEFVQDCRVYGKANPIMGNLVYCDLVLTRKDEKLSESELKRELMKVLPDYMVPVGFNIVELIDVGLTGKKLR